MLGRDELVLQLAHLVLGSVQDTREGGRRSRLLLRALQRGFLGQRGFRLCAEVVRIGDELARQVLAEQREEQVLGVDLGIAATARVLLRGCDRLL